MTTALFDAPRVICRGERFPVLFRPGCLSCGASVRVITESQPALFVHGGYGADRVATYEVCDACRHSFRRSIVEANPRRR